MHIVIADSLPASAAELLRAAGWSVDTKTGRKPDELAKDLSNADALIVRSATRVTADLMDKAPKLRVIGRAGVGVDNVNVEAATAQGVVVMNTPTGNTITTAEHTISLILAHLNSEHAATILSALPPEIQVDVAQRIAVIERATPDIIMEIEKVLERILSEIAIRDIAG